MWDLVLVVLRPSLRLRLTLSFSLSFRLDLDLALGLDLDLDLAKYPTKHVQPVRKNE
jgi:hypothetical protein